MRKTIALTLFTMVVFQMISCSGDKNDRTLDTVDKKFSYIMGYEAVGVISNMETVVIDEEAFIKGIRDAFSNGMPLLTREQGLDVKTVIFDKERIYKNQQIIKDTYKNLTEQELFLKQNKTAEGVITTGSGLQYKIIEKGEGLRPGPEDAVKILSRAKLLDGTVVESLSTGIDPALVPVKGKLLFWEEAFMLMPAGSKFRFFVPSPLAYGDRGNFIQGGRVGPNELIIIDLELLEVENSPAS